MAKTKFFLFVIILQCSPSLLVPVAQQDVASKNNTSLVSNINQTEGITPNNSKVINLIQQIDVKDNANKVISNINNVAISDDTVENTNRNENNGTNVSKENLNNTGATNALDGENITVPKHHNELINETISNGSSKNGGISGDELLPTDNPTKDEEILSAEVPAFRSLKPNKISKRQQPTTVSTTVAPTTAKDHNLVLKFIPNTPPITIDLNQIPLNNLFGEAFHFINRFKRDIHDEDITKLTNNKTVLINGNNGNNEISCNNTITNKDLKITPTRKFLGETIFDIQEMYDTVEIICPLSVIVKLYSHQLLRKIVKNDLHSILNQILSSFMNGEEDAITVISKELSELPIKLKLRLQLVHGETKEFLEELSNIVDEALCKLS